MMIQKVPSSRKFPKIFVPGYIGKLWVKNRLIKSPINTSLSTPDGCVTDRMIKHYRDLAQGGVGLIIVEHAYVDDEASKSAICQLGVSRIEHQPGLRWLAETIKENGAKACLQITHCGIQTFLGTLPLKGPSRVPWELIYSRGVPIPEELSIEEIHRIVEAFGDAALRAKRVGFDMVEVHGGHGYLVTNFLSPRTNKRTDWYGGSLRNRMRFLLEVVENIRKKAGGDYPLSIRLSGTDYQEEDPITIDQTKAVSKELEKAGVNVIHVSGGDHHTIDMEIAPMYWPPASHVWAAEEIKKVANIPVIASGSITSPKLAENILEEGKADFIGLGRPLIADPYFPLKSLEGRPEDIAPCIRCNEGCLDRGVHIGAIHCSVNVTVGRGDELKITPVAKPRKVVIVGGGPAGMEAARVAALRGHSVTLFEARSLGGMLVEASVPEFKADIRRLIDYLSTQIKKAGVKVIHDKATSQTIKDGKFDVVIVAVGGTPWLPDVPGVDKPSVIGWSQILSGVQTGKSVIVVGGGMIGSEVALFLAEQGKKVTITTRQDEIGQALSRATKIALVKRLFKQDAEIHTGVRLEEIGDGGIVASNRSGIKTIIKGDNVILAAGLTPNMELFDELSQVANAEIYAIGDCVKPRTIFDAIHEGYFTGYNIV